MRPRSIAVALAFFMSLLSVLSAQPQARMERLKAVAKQLNLTHAQEKELIPIMQAEEPKLEAIRNDPSLSRLQKLQRLKAVHDESDPQVKAILTPAQYQQLQEIRQKRRAELMQAAQTRPPQ
jgi:protein CpxP